MASAADFLDGKPARIRKPSADEFLGESKKAREKADTPVSGPMEALMSGLSFGWSDELAGLAGGIADWTKGKGFQGGYERRKNAAKQNLEDFQERSPVAGTALPIVGALAGATPRAAMAIPETLLGRMGQGARIGSGFGAVAGAGNAEGDLEDRLTGAGTGAALGAGLGAALPPVFQAGGAAFRHVGNAIGSRNPQQVANEKLAAAIARDETTPARLLSEIDTARSQGIKPEMLSDFGGENVRAVARAASLSPGEGRQIAMNAMRDRQAGQAGRVEQDVLSDLSGAARFPVEQAMEAQRLAAGPLYERAYAQHQAIMTPELEQMLRRPSMQQAMQRAYRIAQEEVRDPTNVLGMTVADDGAVQVTRAPSLQTWDYIKRGIDDEVARFQNPITGRLQGAEGRAVDQTRRTLVAELDQAAPGYAQARAAYAGPTRSAEVYREGRAALRDDADITAREIGQMSAGEREFFRAGVARALRDMAMQARDGGDSVAKIFGSPLTRERIRAAFPDGRAFFNFENAMRREARMFENARTLNPTANSATAMRQADMASAAPSPVMEAGAALMRGEGARASLMQALGAQRAISRAGGYTPEVSERLARMLYSPDYTTQQEALRGILSMPLARNQASQQQERIRRGILAGTAGLAGAGAGR